MAYELSKKALEELSTTVPIDEATIPSPTIRQEPVATEELTRMFLETISSIKEGKQIIRDGVTNRLVAIDRPEPNAKRTVDVTYNKETGELLFVKADGSELMISGLPTLASLGKGPKGKKGKRGEPGKDGRDGKDGPQGYVGDEGPKGQEGPIGVSGADGKPGLSGPVGPAGPRGPDGPEGEAGPQGRKGHTGARGLVGCPGATGADGITGPEANGAVYINTIPPDSSVFLWGYPI